LNELAKWPLVSIIILNYNGSMYLANCLGSVLKSSYDPFEIVLVDNASTDDSISIVKELFKDDRIVIIRNSSNMGFAEGNNVGAEYVRGDYLVFLNNDTKVEPRWLEELVKVMESDPKIGAAQSKLLMLNHDGRIIDSTGDFVDFYGVAIQRDLGEEDVGQHENVEEVFSARGASMIVRHNVLKQVGGFDPDFVLGCEDIDLCWRIRLRGYKVVYVPWSVVFHRGHGTSSCLRKIRRDPIPLLLIKNYDAFNLLLYLFPYSVFTCGAFILDIFLRRNLFLALGRFNAIRWAIFNLRSILVKRYVVQRVIRRVPDSRVKRMMLQSNLALYTRFVVDAHHAMPIPVRLEKLYKWYFSKTDPYKCKIKQRDWR